MTALGYDTAVAEAALTAETVLRRRQATEAEQAWREAVLWADLDEAEAP